MRGSPSGKKRGKTRVADAAAQREKLFIYALLAIVGLLSVASYLAILPPGAQFMMFALSIVFFCFVLYRCDLGRVFFGIKDGQISLAVIFVSLIITVKTGIAVLLSSGVTGFVQVLLEATQRSLDDATVYALGAALLALLSLWFARFDVRAPSVLAMIGEKGRARGRHYLVRAATIFVVLTAFHILVFDITLQWWNIVVGTAFIVATFVLLVLSVVEQQHFHVSFGRFLLIVEHLEDFLYEHFVEMFHRKHTVLFGIAALLVLYPLSDLAAFLIPYTTSIMNSGYAAVFAQPGHVPLAPLAYRAFAASQAQGTLAVIVYTLNAMALLLGLALPALFWYRMFRKRTLSLSPGAVGLSLAAATTFLLAPAFELGMLSASGLPYVGVDIMTLELPLTGLGLTLALAGLLGVFGYMLAKRHPTQASFMVVVLSLAFFGRYMVLYFSDTWSDLVSAAITFLRTPGLIGLLSGFLFVAFVALSALFYVGALAVYFYEIWVTLWHEHHKRTRENWPHRTQ